MNENGYFGSGYWLNLDDFGATVWEYENSNNYYSKTN